jgi:hypothetical protein
MIETRSNTGMFGGRTNWWGPVWIPVNDRCVLLLPLALSRTQDDKGRVRWTLFGNSEQGPGKAFWRSFFTAPGVEAPPEFGIDFFCRLFAGRRLAADAALSRTSPRSPG